MVNLKEYYLKISKNKTELLNNKDKIINFIKKEEK